MVVGAREGFQFFRQKSWFLKNNRALSNFVYGIFAILYYYCQIIKKSVHETQFYINHASHLNHLSALQLFTVIVIFHYISVNLSAFFF